MRSGTIADGIVTVRFGRLSAVARRPQGGRDGVAQRFQAGPAGRGRVAEAANDPVCLACFERSVRDD